MNNNTKILKSNSKYFFRPFPKYSQGLPILERKEEILNAIVKNQVVVIAGETGSGKTTQLPVICIEAGRGINGKIGCTQPRRIAAVSIADRVASELGCTMGQEVGYKIRFSDHDAPRTCIKFMTDGILLAEIERDPELLAYDTLIIDEAHERSLNIDFILGYLRKLLKRRPDLKIIISSATIDTALFSKSFNNAPVIEVSGRMYPVELLYLSDDKEDDDDYDSEDDTYVDRAVKAAQDIMDMYGFGDMLIFMPTERDIRETCDRLKGAKLNETVVLPLFSRLSRSEQESIFRNYDRRKIVIATNIAETSITVPGIKFVIDTGLARISRYVPRLRTNRLPIEPVSKAAADQRKGRCGRVMDGVCVRLYSEKDFLIRDAFTQPEIKRANLAGVILSMIAHRLGDIESFDFLEPPSSAAISEGYALLRELGAIDRDNRLTVLGKQMARLPLDPHIARMVIAAKSEHALREVKIIAAALSIVDPRERPFDKQAEADVMHKKFRVPGSDFLSFVLLWDSYQQELYSLKTQNKMRKFCKDHFLSYTRMQEWHDVKQQLDETVLSMKDFEENLQPASSDAVHRSLLAGLLSNCAYKAENGKYHATRGREVIIFPGSSLAGQKPEWLVCHEVLETSQLFAHTAAPIRPEWLEDVGAHLCSRSYSEPYFDSETGVVRAVEKVSLFGVHVASHHGVSYGKIDPVKATDVFIWQGLIEEQLQCSHRFFINNKKLRIEIEELESKLRTRSLFAGEPAMAAFYSQRLKGIGSIHDLNRVIKEHGGDDFLFMQKEDILAVELSLDLQRYPDKVTIGGKEFPLQYAFEPGADRDGITLSVPLQDAPYIPESSIEYLVPALWPARILELLRNLPKETRKKLMPLHECSQKLSDNLTISAESFEVSLSQVILRLYKVEVDPVQLSGKCLPQHLLMRVEIHGKNGDVVASGKGGAILKNIGKELRVPDKGWNDAFKQYEKNGLTQWNFGDLPEHIEVVSSEKGIPLYGYPALRESVGAVDLVLCRSAQDAQLLHRFGVRKLLDVSMSSEFAWIEKELRFSQQLKLLCTPFGGADGIRNLLLKSIREYLLNSTVELPVNKSQFDSLLLKIKGLSKGIGYEALSLIESVITLYNENNAKIVKMKDPRHVALKKELSGELQNYINELRCEVMNYELFRQYPRYLKAYGYRINRAFLEPLKFGRNRALLQDYYVKLKFWNCNDRDSVLWKEIEEYRLMVEEFAISLFAQQEVKTLFPVSVQRLDKKIAQIEVMKKKMQQ